MQVTAEQFNKMQLAILYEFIQEHPDIRQTKANGQALGGYLAEHGLTVSWKNLGVAYTNLKAAGKLELSLTPEQQEQARIEKVRQLIYSEVAAKIAPAKIDFTNPSTISKIASWLHVNEKGLMSTDRVLRAIEAHKFDEGFWVVEPANLYKSQDYVHGRRNFAKDAKPTEEEIPDGPLGRRNHALDDVFDRESANRVKNLKKGIDEEEGRRIGMVVEHAISGYRAQKFNRIDKVQTEIIQGLLRKYSAKYGTGVISAIRDLPDDPNAAEMWLRRRL